MSTHYETLGVEPNATTGDIKVAYRRRVRSEHPDHGGDSARFHQVHQAFTVLGDPAARERYDELLKQPPKPDRADPSAEGVDHEDSGGTESYEESWGWEAHQAGAPPSQNPSGPAYDPRQPINPFPWEMAEPKPTPRSPYQYAPTHYPNSSRRGWRRSRRFPVPVGVALFLLVITSVAVTALNVSGPSEAITKPTTVLSLAVCASIGYGVSKPRINRYGHSILYFIFCVLGVMQVVGFFIYWPPVGVAGLAWMALYVYVVEAARARRARW